MSPPVDPVPSSAEQPKKVDAVIIGGGIIGVSDGLLPGEEGGLGRVVRKGRDRR